MSAGSLFPKMNSLIANASALAALNSDQREIIASAADATPDWAVATSVDDAAGAQAFREAGGTVIEADQARQRMKARWGGSGAAPPGRVGAIAAS